MELKMDIFYGSVVHLYVPSVLWVAFSIPLGSLLLMNHPVY
jgi:hypothetical protein